MDIQTEILNSLESHAERYGGKGVLSTRAICNNIFTKEALNGYIIPGVDKMAIVRRELRKLENMAMVERVSNTCWMRANQSER